MQLPKTLLEAVRHFSDLDVCNEYLASIKWPGGKPICPACGSDRVGELKSRRKLQCRVKACHKQFSFKINTIFEDSPLGLDKWLVAVWCVATEAKVSSTLLAAMIGVTQKTARRMIHVIKISKEIAECKTSNIERSKAMKFLSGTDALAAMSVNSGAVIESEFRSDRDAGFMGIQ